METNITAVSSALCGEEKYKDLVTLKTQTILRMKIDFFLMKHNDVPIAGKLIVENTKICPEVYKNTQNKDDAGKKNDKEFIENYRQSANKPHVKKFQMRYTSSA